MDSNQPLKPEDIGSHKLNHENTIYLIHPQPEGLRCGRRPPWLVCVHYVWVDLSEQGTFCPALFPSSSRVFCNSPMTPQDLSSQSYWAALHRTTYMVLGFYTTIRNTSQYQCFLTVACVPNWSVNCPEVRLRPLLPWKGLVIVPLWDHTGYSCIGD